MKILLADDNPEVRTALRLILEHHTDHEIEAEAGNVVRLLSLCTQVCPDAILLDTELSGLKPSRDHCGLLDLLQTLRHLCPRAYLAALCNGQISGKEGWVSQVDAVFCKSDPPDALLNWLAQSGCKN
jgi:DNA-binding NarL/FixJ family response regulator